MYKLQKFKTGIPKTETACKEYQEHGISNLDVVTRSKVADVIKLLKQINRQ